MSKNLFPVFLNLEGKKALVVGLGTVALRKAKILNESGAEVLAVGKILKEKDLHLYSTVHIRNYHDEDIRDVFIAVAATDDPVFNRSLCEMWEQHNIITNNATSRTPENAFFVHSAPIDDCLVAVSGYGNPANARKLLDKLLNHE
ncbi:MAG: precorrin-2 dehydrogenase/sirohydrochlorin ferrochelatase family protein [Brevinema sp.]